MVAIAVDCYILHHTTFRLSIVPELYSKNSLHYIISLAPLVLGVTFYFVGSLAQRLEVKNDVLVKMNKRLEGYSESYHVFTYHISHELKSTLNDAQALALMVRKYQAKGDTVKVDELIASLIQTNQYSEQTLLDFLKLHKLVHAVPDGVSATLDFQKEIFQIVDLLNKVAVFEFKFGKTDFNSLLWRTDETVEVFNILITNSIKYSLLPPVITIDLIQEQEKQIIVYQDNSRGIDMEKYGDAIFMPFAKFEEGPKHDSTRMELYIIKRIVELHEGKVSLVSAPGKGLQIRIEL
jgi:light-regulated signal transduction histidine kinase (bacteriophytochrome)